MKLLLLEDELHLRQSIKRYLELKGHTVDEFENGEELLEHSNPSDYECMILDINTPEVDGFEVLSYLRDHNVLTPALYISALTDANKVVKGFELGAQDYLKKPFDLVELEARILRLNPLGNTNIQLDEVFSYDLDSRTLYKEKKECKLSPTQKKLLYLLIKQQNTLVTFDQIRDYIWGDKEISHSTILSTMRDLKKLIPQDFIQNIKGEGYKVIVAP